MRSRANLVLSISALCLGLVAVPLAGHHAFSAEFDADQPVQLKGIVVKTEWINPHTGSTLRSKNRQRPPVSG